MSWPFSIRNAIYPKEKYVWAQIRIIYETDKAILADNGRKFWIPKWLDRAPAQSIKKSLCQTKLLTQGLSKKMVAFIVRILFFQKI
jgi:hypothetical protein